MKCLKSNEDLIQIQDIWHGEREWGLWNVNINITYNFIACGSVSQSWDTEPVLLFLDLSVSLFPFQDVQMSAVKNTFRSCWGQDLH